MIRKLLSHSLVAMILMTSMGYVSPVPVQAATAVPKIKSSSTELYNSVTGRTFTPRGANYVRLAQTSDGSVYHSTFEPGLYNAAAARSFLDGMQRSGYNTARVFIDPGGGSSAHGLGRGMDTSDVAYGPYMDNVANFALEAASRGIYVIPSLDDFPANSYYWNIVAREIAGVGTPNMAGRNLTYLDKGRTAAKAEYLKQFAAALVARIGISNKNVILAYQSDNEVFFDASQAPYDKLSGTVTALDGTTYDMSQAASRQQSADATLVVYSQKLKEQLLASDQDALLAMGFFTNQAVGKTGYNGLMTYCSTACDPTINYWVPGRPALVSMYGGADVIDLHLYPNAPFYNAAAELVTVEASSFQRPYLIGELGALKSVYGNSIVAAAYGMRDARVVTCKLGAKGWLSWTWDTYENLASQDTLYKLVESNGAINGQMAPIVQPDPCTPYTVQGAIRTQWDAAGGQYGPHGWATSTEAATPSGRARFNTFQNGAIYLTNGATQAQSVYGGIYQAYRANGLDTGWLGLPLTSEANTRDNAGRFNKFERGIIMWTPSLGAHTVGGGIYARYAALNLELSYLGYPTSDEYSISGGRRSNFQYGYITWNASTGVVTDRRY